MAEEQVGKRTEVAFCRRTTVSPELAANPLELPLHITIKQYIPTFVQIELLVAFCISLLERFEVSPYVLYL